MLRSTPVVLLAVTISVLAGLYKEFFLLTFDPEGARVSGLPVRALDTGFTILTAITASPPNPNGFGPTRPASG